jgi:hypothetical protein
VIHNDTRSTKRQTEYFTFLIYVFFKTSMLMRSALFWGVTRYGLVIPDNPYISSSSFKKSKHLPFYYYSPLLPARSFSIKTLGVCFHLLHPKETPHVQSFATNSGNTILLEKLSLLYTQDIPRFLRNKTIP